MPYQNKTINRPGNASYPFNSEGKIEIFPDSGFTHLARVTVYPLPSNYAKPEGYVPQSSVVNNKTNINVSSYALINVFEDLFTDKELIERQTRFTDLKRIELMNGTRRVTSLFRAHANLQEVVLPASCTTLMPYAFYDCKKLEKINLENVTEIGTSAFNSANKLEIITTSNLSSLENSVWVNCTGLKTAIINGPITVLPESTFRHDNNLENVTLSNNITTIGNGAFYNCSKLYNITIPANVTTMGSDIFTTQSGYTPLEPLTVTMLCTAVPTITSTTFGNRVISKIRVLPSLVEDYKAAANWSAFADKIEAIA